MTISTISKVALLAGFAAVAAMANAAPGGNGGGNQPPPPPPPPPAGYCNLNTATGGIALTDVTYGVNFDPLVAGSSAPATDCYGIAADNDDVGLINGLSWATGTTYGTGSFTSLGRDNVGQDDLSVGALGYTWTITQTQSSPATSPDSGTYVLSAIVDPNYVPLQSLPAYFDFVVTLKGSNGWAAYLFDEARFDGSGGGTWTVKIQNNGGQFADLSHLSVYGRGGSTPPDETVPEPSSLALAGLALLGLGWARRRRT